MTLSFWRYSHLLLALTSTLFLIIASVTGVILACEPIYNNSQAYNVIDLEDISTATTLQQLMKEYDEVLSIEVTANDEVIASVITKDGKSEKLYIHPKTGSKLGIVQERNSIFIWTTNLHRSLFLKSTGRFFVGFISLILCFIAMTGLLLLAQRQGGVLKLYNRIKERDFNQRYHIILGRWLLVPIIIIAATGIYLSAVTFELIPTHIANHDWGKEPLQQVSTGKVSDILFFKELPLDEVRSINFPFSEDEFDYFEVSLQDRDLLIHQYSGEIISEIDHPFSFLLSRWSFNLHTGTGHVLWSLILLISSASILFFIFSGFAMYLKRRRNTKTTLPSTNKDDSEIIILVGSESGKTYAFAKAITQQLSRQGKKIFLGLLNEYTKYEKATQLLILTSTYGDGSAPSNARLFLEKLPQIKQPNAIKFAVLGFGSMDYEHYCRFAIQVDASLHDQDDFKPLMPLVKINEQSELHMNAWLKKWYAMLGVSQNQKYQKELLQYASFEVLERSSLNLDQTFLLRLKPLINQEFQSGDILNILAPNSDKPRAYSIAKLGGDILLSIKKHDKGNCSSYLSELNASNLINASIEENTQFHLPINAKPVIFISNGTGIAPFLGMINDRKSKKQELHFFWGGRFKNSFELYQPFIDMAKNDLSVCQLSFSRELEQKYIQDEIWDRSDLIAQSLKNGGQIMICGSISMREDVLTILEKIFDQDVKTPLSYFESNGQILTDCY